MNAPVTHSEGRALTTAAQQTSALMLSPQLMQQMMAVAEAMSTATIAVPQHFRGKTGDCLAVVMQATQWNMNPFGVAQKTHVVNGTLGYEAQLVHAVLEASGAIEGTFNYEYRGEGNNLECRVGAVCRGDREVTWNEWLSIAGITVKNSPLWKTNPKQQIGYLQVKNWARAFKPGAILGVYTTDELAQPTERHMGPAEVVQPGAEANGAASAGTAHEVVTYPQADFEKNFPSWESAIKKGGDPEAVIKKVQTKAPLTDEQKAKIRAAKPAAAAPAPDQQQPTDAAPKFTYAQVADRIQKAGDADALAIARDLIPAVTDPEQRKELQTLADTREGELA